jgi:hypothetical protein
MVYGPFSLVSVPAAQLSLQASYLTEAGFDFARWCASPDGITFSCFQVSGDSGGWGEFTLDLAAVPVFGSLLGDGTVWVALQFESDLNINFAGGMFVDNVKVRRCIQNCSLAAPVAVPEDWEAVVIDRTEH